MQDRGKQGETKARIEANDQGTSQGIVKRRAIQDNAKLALSPG